MKRMSVEEAKQEDTNNIMTIKKKNFFLIIVIMALLSVATVFVSKKYYDLNVNIATQEFQQELSQKEQDAILDNIEEHILISRDTEPFVAIIDNVDKLKQTQTFFEKSENGDVLVVFNDKAIIYRPDSDLLINVGPVYFNNQETAASAEEGQDLAQTEETQQEDVVESEEENSASE